MQIPVQISFRNIEPSPAVEARVRERVAKLDQFFDRIMSCRVMIEAPDRQKRKGKLYHVRIELGVPGKELVVDRSPKEKHAHEDVYVAIRDAFDAARRQLQDHARKLDDRIKTHAEPLHGKVIELHPDDGYGFVAASDGREIYFHEHSVIGGEFERLKIGSEVRLAVAEAEGINGPQASTVHVVGKHHIID